MGSPYLNNNESIILSTHNVVINTIPAEAILTNQRLILVDARHTQLRPQDIPFTAIETVTIGDNSAMDPVLSISLVLQDETRHQLGIVFTQLPKTRRVGERDEWAVKLKESSVAAQHPHGVQPADLLPPWVPGALPEEAEDVTDQAPADEKFRNPPLVPRKPKTPVPGNRKILLAGGILVIVIIIALAGYFLAPSLFGKGGTSAETVATPITMQPTAVPTIIQATGQQTPVPAQTTTLSPTPTTSVTAIPTTEVQSGIPQSGVWVQITYAGNFTGAVGASGRMTDITGSGNQLYQIPAKNEILEATIQKLDDSGNPLTVTFYNMGVAANTGTISTPHGTLDLHADLRSKAPVAAAGNTGVVNPTSGT
ncbi:hypothetical protein [Methanoregula sp.]|jgi:hypothetical protein|uniref:hypothetical protein n=1 Tax=Methanoregula sp. TaxID=2052170 RepID=UPI003C1DF061